MAVTQGDGGDDKDGKIILEGCKEGLVAAKAAKAVADAKAATAASSEGAEMEVKEDDEQDGEEDEDEDEEDDDEQVIEIMDVEGGDEGDVDDEDEGELVWDPDWDEARKAEAWAKQDRLSAAGRVKEMKLLPPPYRQRGGKLKMQVEKIRRVHSGETDNGPDLIELFDLTADSYVPYGTALYPKAIEVDEDEEMLLEVKEDERMLLDI